jgi:hypothetical protein
MFRVKRQDATLLDGGFLRTVLQNDIFPPIKQRLTVLLSKEVSFDTKNCEWHAQVKAMARSAHSGLTLSLLRPESATGQSPPRRENVLSTEDGCLGGHR